MMRNKIKSRKMSRRIPAHAPFFPDVNAFRQPLEGIYVINNQVFTPQGQQFLAALVKNKAFHSPEGRRNGVDQSFAFDIPKLDRVGGLVVVKPFNGENGSGWAIGVGPYHGIGRREKAERLLFGFNIPKFKGFQGVRLRVSGKSKEDFFLLHKHFSDFAIADDVFPGDDLIGSGVDNLHFVAVDENITLRVQPYAGCSVMPRACRTNVFAGFKVPKLHIGATADQQIFAVVAQPQ